MVEENQPVQQRDAVYLSQEKRDGTFTRDVRASQLDAAGDINIDGRGSR